MRWRVELRLSPGRGVIEQRVALDHPTPVRHRYYWWSNAAVQVWDDSRLVYPTAFMATHGMTRIVPWPVNEQGVDLSVIRNQTAGPVSLFTYGTREPYVGVYHPRTKSGTVHWASPAELPTRKAWSWGANAAARDWRRALSDNDWRRSTVSPVPLTASSSRATGWPTWPPHPSCRREVPKSSRRAGGRRTRGRASSAS